MSEYEMPLRPADEGMIGLDRMGPRHLRIQVGGSCIVMSTYNAWRLFGLLSVMLGLPLSSKVSKAIKL